MVQLLPPFFGRDPVGLLLLFLGFLTAATSYRRWAFNERAIRNDAPLPASRLPKVLAIGVAVVGLVAAKSRSHRSGKLIPRPDHVFDASVQQERTALAWERTAVALMVAGGLVLKFGSDMEMAWAEILGLVTVVGAAIILAWAARRYESLHQALRAGSDITYPLMVATVSALTSILSAGALILVLL